MPARCRRKYIVVAILIVRRGDRDGALRRVVERYEVRGEHGGRRAGPDRRHVDGRQGDPLQGRAARSRGGQDVRGSQGGDPDARRARRCARDARAQEGALSRRGGVLGIGESNFNACLKTDAEKAIQTLSPAKRASATVERARLPFLLAEHVEVEDEADRLVGCVDRPVGGVLAVAAGQRERAATVGERHLDRLDADRPRAPRACRARPCRRRAARSIRWSPGCAAAGRPTSASSGRGSARRSTARSADARRGSPPRRAAPCCRRPACERSTASRGTAPLPTGRSSTRQLFGAPGSKIASEPDATGSCSGSQRTSIFCAPNRSP